MCMGPVTGALVDVAVFLLAAAVAVGPYQVVMP
ncbi:hypothetical protein AB7M22_002913 [Pseudomonas sp. ADAK2 TE3594]